MKSIIEFIKEKSYYFLGGTILLMILFLIITSCSNKNNLNSYDDIEEKMVLSAKKYYEDRPNSLPKENNGSVKVNISTLVEAELMNEVTDPKNSSNKCSGYVEVTKIEDEYSYIPFLTCSGNYEPKYLVDEIKSVQTDEYGNGVYNLNGSYVYRGDDVNNYVSFNDMLWRIIKIDSEGDIKLVLKKKTKEYYTWDSAYNSDKKDRVGITTNYLNTDIRKSLDDYYDVTFTNENKAKIVSKNICVGSLSPNGAFDTNKECLVIKENEKVSLLNASDYQNASLDSNCKLLSSKECSNYNYLYDSDIHTWLLNPSSENTYKVFALKGGISDSKASNETALNPVIYLNSKIIISGGKGTLEEPYIIK